MKLSQIKEKMRVRVNTDLSKTITEWTFGGSDAMPNMRGKSYIVAYIQNGGVALKNSSKTWIFCPEDLSPTIETKPIPPVMFDPENIDI